MNRLRSFRRLFHPRHWPAWAKIVAALVALIALAGIATVGGIAIKYSRIAAGYDLKAVDEMETGALVRDSAGKDLGRIFIESRSLVRLDEVSPLLVDAVVATEDARFFHHPGFDMIGMLRSAVVNVEAGEIKQGGSTITQQLARHVYHLRGKSFDRKFTEIFVALRLEERYSKHRILEHYLNRIYLGSGFYGIGSATEGYFGVAPSQVNLAQAATIAGIIKGPSSFSPFVDADEARRVRNLTLCRMRDLGMIGEKECSETCALPVEVLPESQRDNQPDFALEAIRREVESHFSKRLQLDGGTVESTLEGRLNLVAVEAIQRQLEKVEAEHPESTRTGDRRCSADERLEGAAVVIDNQSGALLAAVGGRDFATGSFDRAFLGRRPPGTAFLPFVYATYLDQDPTHLHAEVLDAPLDNASVMVGGTDGMLAEWGADAGRFEDRLTMPFAFVKSKTGAAVRIGNRCKFDDFIALVKQSGIRSELRPYPASFLGSSSVRVIELARAFTAFPNAGAPCPPVTTVTAVNDRHGGRHVGPDGLPPAGAMRPETAVILRELMAARLREPRYAEMLAVNGLDRLGLIGQPGSSYGFHDGWFLGSDRHVTCAVWVGQADGRKLPVDYPGLTMAMPIWSEIMAAACDSHPEGWPLDADHLDDAVCLRSDGRATAACLDDPAGLVIRSPVLAGFRSEACRHADLDHEPDAPPKAVPVVNSAHHRYVEPQGPIVEGEDPYRVELR
ncbi:transglycosylase domain-containing protein [Haloferula sargassicola]|uniref:peptidoglycan glycosyltransferase n=1 Tax=Haloferula sargassicola TaxID=490096 RepID=A0ABP9URL2_9BACT